MLPIVLASLLMVLACRGNDYYWNIANATEESRQDKQERQEILELIWEDKEHLYLTHREDTRKKRGDSMIRYRLAAYRMYIVCMDGSLDCLRMKMS